MICLSRIVCEMLSIVKCISDDTKSLSSSEPKLYQENKKYV